MRRHTGPAAIVVAALALSVVLLPAAAPAAVHAQADGLLPVKFGLPVAKSGQLYVVSIAGAATGGTKPYRCTPEALHVGSLKLGSDCKIAGTAPVLGGGTTKSVTGPFKFKLTDSAKPPKTVTLYPLYFTTIIPSKPEAPASPTVPAGWQLVASKHANDAVLSDIPEFDSGEIGNPQSLAIRIIGFAKPDPYKTDEVDVDRICFPASIDTDWSATYTHTGGAGLHVIPVPAGATSCIVNVLQASGVGSLTIQILAKTGTAPTPTPTPTPTPKPKPGAFDGTWQGAFTGSITETDQPAVFGGPTTFDVNDSAFQVDIVNGVLSIFYGTSLSFVGEPQIGADGSATLITSIPGSQATGGPDVTPCQFAIQFSRAGTADGVGQLSCKYSYVASVIVSGVTEPETITYVYIGLFHMTRTSTP
jgi:hypothetical protein